MSVWSFVFRVYLRMSIIATAAGADFTRCKINHLWKTKRPTLKNIQAKPQSPRQNYFLGGRIIAGGFCTRTFFTSRDRAVTASFTRSTGVGWRFLIVWGWWNALCRTTRLSGYTRVSSWTGITSIHLWVTALKSVTDGSRLGGPIVPAYCKCCTSLNFPGKTVNRSYNYHL